jgi:TPR repeat protein
MNSILAGNAVRMMMYEKRKLLILISSCIGLLVVFYLAQVASIKGPQATKSGYALDAWTSIEQIEPAEDVTRFRQSLASISRERYEDAIPVVMQLARDGVVEAQVTLGNLYAEGKGVAKNREEAVMWHRKAAVYYRQMADLGDVPAQYKLGLLYLEGVGFESSEGLSWIVMAARQGHPEAQFKLANIQTESSAVPNKEHLKWLEESARNGHAPAQYKLGTYFEQGNGVEKSPSRAKYWLTRAAKQGYRPEVQMEPLPLDP